MAVSPDGKLVYATVNTFDYSKMYSGDVKQVYNPDNPGGVVAIDTESLKIIKNMVFPEMKSPSLVAFTPDGKKAYAICGVSDSATPIDVADHEPGEPIFLDIGG